MDLNAHERFTAFSARYEQWQLDEMLLLLLVAYTMTASIAISTAPTFVSKDINPSVNYARYIALFHVGADTVSPVDNNISDAELFETPRLIAVVDTEGHMIDENIADMNPQ